VYFANGHNNRILVPFALIGAADTVNDVTQADLDKAGHWDKYFLLLPKQAAVERFLMRMDVIPAAPVSSYR
jgi:hypothetical protein